MESSSGKLPPPPPPSVIPTGVVPMKLSETKQRVPMARPGYGQNGPSIDLQSNHFLVKAGNTKECFYRYSVAISYEDGKSVDAKGIFRKVLNRVREIYAKELSYKCFAYDGEKSIFTFGFMSPTVSFGCFPRKNLTLTVDMEEPSSSTSESPDKKKGKRSTYEITISHAAKITMGDIFDVFCGKECENCQEAVRVLDTILRQHAVNQDHFLVRQSFFHNEASNFVDIGGGVVGCKGFHSSFRPTIGGLSLNIGVSTKTFVRPGPVLEFLLDSQNIKDPLLIDWTMAERMLKNIRIKARPSNLEYKIIGFSDQICMEQTFSMKQKNKDELMEITVYKYFMEYRDTTLSTSENLRCISAGSPKHAVFLPIEVCTLLPLQRYTKSLTYLQRTSFVENSRQNPEKMIEVLTDALNRSNYNDNPLLKSSGISIINKFTEVKGRILEAPKLIVGNEANIFPSNGRWNFNEQTLWIPVKIKSWIIVNFSAAFRDVSGLSRRLIMCAERKGISLSNPIDTFKENGMHSHKPAHNRVEIIVENIKKKIPIPPEFILCILPEKKNSDLYGPWKKKSLCDLGIVTQCIVPTKINDQYLTNVLLKINAKMGGINSLLSIEHTKSIPLISNVPTMIIGMDVWHGSHGQNVPSIAAVVSSRAWPLISRYMAVVRTQSPKREMIDALYKKGSDNEDEGIFRELLEDFKESSTKRPEQIIIFRDGVSESQFTQVLNIELEQVIQACKLFDDTWSPKFLVIIAQKNHHTRLFQVEQKKKNVSPGTVIDKGICHPQNNDFYMYAHAGSIGTSTPVHYHVLHDDIGCSADLVQELVHHLSYVYQRSTTAVSLVAPVYYAHHAAAQVSKFIDFDGFSETSSYSDSSVPELPRLHKNPMGEVSADKTEVKCSRTVGMNGAEEIAWQRLVVMPNTPRSHTLTRTESCYRRDRVARHAGRELHRCAAVPTPVPLFTCPT